MRKKIGIVLLIAVLVVHCFVPVANSASVNALFNEEDALLENEAAEGGDLDETQADDLPVTETQPVPAPVQGQTAVAPAMRWTYPVSLTALYSPFNMLVNAATPLDSSFEPDDLVKMTVKRATSATVMMDRTAGIALEEMFEAAKAEGYRLFLKSGYRSYGTQKTTYTNRLASNNGKDDGVVAAPGASEHQTGLSCDILNEDYAGRPRMTTDFSETKEAQWLKEFCADFGFILRYPDGKQEITKIIFEPWHFRYVGKEIAAYIMRKEITLEEFWDEWQVQVMEFQGKGGDVDAWIAYEAQRTVAGEQPIFYLLDIYDDEGDQEVSLSF